MPIKTLRIATRKSPLALWQAEDVAERLRRHHPKLQIELIKMSTSGDKVLDSPLAKIGGKGLFVKELEQGMLDGSADIAVHSMKDVPVELPEGLHLTTILKREDPRDAFVSKNFASLEQLPSNARIGTCSLRRQAQIKERFPTVNILDLRGNVNSRLQKLENDEFDAIILAAAGLIRLGFSDQITGFIDAEQSLPAIGQGAVGIECRQNDSAIEALLAPLHDTDTALRVRAERALNQRLHGGCQAPIAGYALLDQGQIHLRGMVGQADGSHIIRTEKTGSSHDPEALGRAVAEDLLAQGADKILAELDIHPE